MPRRKKPAPIRFTSLPPKQHECFTDKEWGEWWNQFYFQFWSKVRHPDVYAMACEDCDLEYQVVSMMNGTCLPPDPTATPVAKLLAMQSDADVPAPQLTLFDEERITWPVTT